MSDISKKILDTIKGRELKPKPRWHFIMRQILIWFTALLSVIIGSFTFSVILFRIVNNDWEVLKFINRSPVAHVLNTLPYVWIVLLVLFVALAYYNARHTKGAYKYQAYWFVAGSIVISIAFGSVFYAVGIGPRVHQLGEQVPVFRELMKDRDALWLDPDNGLLAGEVTGILSGVGIFAIEDFNGNYWVVTPAQSYMPPPSHFELEPGAQIRMMGRVLDVELFEAERVMPYNIGPGMNKGGVPGCDENCGSGRLRLWSK